MEAGGGEQLLVAVGPHREAQLGVVAGRLHAQPRQWRIRRRTRACGGDRRAEQRAARLRAGTAARSSGRPPSPRPARVRPAAPRATRSRRPARRRPAPGGPRRPPRGAARTGRAGRATHRPQRAEPSSVVVGSIGLRSQPRRSTTVNGTASAGGGPSHTPANRTGLSGSPRPSPPCRRRSGPSAGSAPRWCRPRARAAAAVRSATAAYPPTSSAERPTSFVCTPSSRRRATSSRVLAHRRQEPRWRVGDRRGRRPLTGSRPPARARHRRARCGAPRPAGAARGRSRTDRPRGRPAPWRTAARLDIGRTPMEDPRVEIGEPAFAHASAWKATTSGTVRRATLLLAGSARRGRR